jgi:hypothetical protein
LLEKYPGLLKQDTIRHFDTIKIERVKIETVILPKTDTIEIERIISPVSDSIQRIIVTRNIFRYLEKLRKIDTVITEKDISLWVHTDSLGRLMVSVIREARNEVKEATFIRSGYKIQEKEPPWKTLLKIALPVLVISVILVNFFYRNGK